MGRKGDGEGVQSSGDTCIASFFKLPGILLLF